MTTLSYAAKDSATMLRRSLRHIVRYPSMTITLIALPLVFLLLFVYVFGGTLGSGLGGESVGRAAYVNYVTPGILLLAIAGGATGTAVSVATDMTEGIVARFRTMRISQSSVLTGHVLGSMIQTALCVVVVLGAAVAIGFRPTASPVEWVAALGLLALITLALTWISVALGMISKSVETASNLPTPFALLPFLGSGFVPTDSMPTVLRWFAEYQPFTPIIETLRGLLLGSAIGSSAVVAIGWSFAIGLAGFFWARALFRKSPAV
ncbi:ABC transporter permease [Antrihabitans sp. NCIMB 15449]|uniref:Transport permease protein n=1 Tax=Antrihabitans spumae TaxID=3373370 RepID=A0ABW7JTC4_9NOCA